MNKYNNNATKKISGFSMIELVVAMAIATIVSLMALPGIHYIMKAQKHVQESAALDTSYKTLSHLLPIYLGYGVDVEWTGGVINNIGNSSGQLRRFVSGMTNAPQDPVTVGLFLRESGSPGNDSQRSELRATALYFRRPSIRTPGELIISTSGFGNGNVQLSSEQAVHRFDNIVELSIAPSGQNTPNGSPVRVVEMQVTFRKFTHNNEGGEFWCPSRFIDNRAGCGQNNYRNFRDVVRTYTIPLVNNAIQTTDFMTTGSFRQEGLYGNLYFFKHIFR